MKLGVFTDPHCSDKTVTCGTRRPSLSPLKIKEAMAYFVTEKADAVLCMGDLTDYCINPQDNGKMLEETVHLIASYGIPFYCMRGNHDCDAFTKEEFYSVSGITPPPFTLKGTHGTAVFLDACYRKDGTEYRKGAVDWENTALPVFEIEKLGGILNNAKLPKITVFIHQNLSPVPHGSHIVANAERVRKMFAEYPGKLRVFEGHYHPGYNYTEKGVEYTVLPAMCEGEKNSFTIVDI